MKHDRLDKTLIITVIAVNLTITILSLLWLFTEAFLVFKLTLKDPNQFGLNEKATYGLFAAGALGGASYCLRALYQRLGDAYTRDYQGKEVDPTKILNIKVWFFWYLYRPLQGGIVALVLLALVNSNFLVTEHLSAASISSFYTHIALGFIAGFGTHELIQKIEEIIRVVFAKSAKPAATSEDKIKENEGKH